MRLTCLKSIILLECFQKVCFREENYQSITITFFKSKNTPTGISGYLAQKVLMECFLKDDSWPILYKKKILFSFLTKLNTVQFLQITQYRQYFGNITFYLILSYISFKMKWMFNLLMDRILTVLLKLLKVLFHLVSYQQYYLLLKLW